MWMSVASRMPKSVPLSVTVSLTRSALTCSSVTGGVNSWCAITPLETVGHALRREGRRGAARGVALHVDCHRVHRDVRRRELDVHGERGRVAAEPLRSDTELIHRARELCFELRALRVLALRAERTDRRELGERDAEIRAAADADADDGRRAGLAARIEHAIHDEGLDRVHSLGRHRHLEPGIVLRAAALGDHLYGQLFRTIGVAEMNRRNADSARGLVVDAGDRVHDGRTQGVLVRRPGATSRDRGFEIDSIHLDIATDGDVVDRHPGVLAGEVVRRFGHGDVLDDRAEDLFRARARLRRIEPLEALLDVRRQDLQSPYVKLLARLLDLLQVNLHASLENS